MSGESRRVRAAALCLLAATLPRAAPAKEEERALLVVAFDAVPYEAAAAAIQATPGGEPALLPGFHPPVPLVSAFPSTTSVAVAEILSTHGLERSPGYEARFFDWERRRRVGGGPVAYRRMPFPWRDFFDWTRKGPLESALQALRPVAASVREVEQAFDGFVDSPAPAYLVYIAPTDTAMHLCGPSRECLRPIFAALDRELAELRARRAARPFDTVIFSDHGIAGGAPLVNVRRRVVRALRSEGLTVGKRLRRPGEAVLTPFGLVSSFEVYLFEEDEGRVAAALAAVPGVDLCARATQDGWEVHGGAGGAAFLPLERQGKRWWSYAAEGEDPLGLVPRGESALFPDGGFPVADSRPRYPDALHRIARAFELVDNPASVLCSVAPGHMYGSRRTAALARIGKGRLRWTHGALDWEATAGFVMSDAADWHPAGLLRASEALAPFAARVRLAKGLPAEPELVASPSPP